MLAEAVQVAVETGLLDEDEGREIISGDAAFWKSRGAAPWSAGARSAGDAWHGSAGFGERPAGRRPMIYVVIDILGLTTLLILMSAFIVGCVYAAAWIANAMIDRMLKMLGRRWLGRRDANARRALWMWIVIARAYRWRDRVTREEIFARYLVGTQTRRGTYHRRCLSHGSPRRFGL